MARSSSTGGGDLLRGDHFAAREKNNAISSIMPIVEGRFASKETTSRTFRLSWISNMGLHVFLPQPIVRTSTYFIGCSALGSPLSLPMSIAREGRAASDRNRLGGSQLQPVQG